MSDTYISDSIKYIGADDTTLDLFESQYIVPNGVSYNSYIIMDEKIAVMDTVDQRKTDEWFDNLNKALDGKTPDYLVVSHRGVDDEVNIYFTSNHILFEFDETKVVSRLIECSNYFDTDKMISNDYKTKITINKKEMANCIDRATLLIKEGDKKPVFLTIKDTEMELSINTFIGSMDESIPIVREGSDMMISFNPKFLIDILRVLDSEEVNIYFTNPKAPCFIRDDENSYIYVVLPVVQ